MNDNLKYAAIGVSSLVLGFVTGYIVANVKAGRLIEKEFGELSDKYDASVDEIRAKYEDGLARATKTGAYSTPESAESVLIQTDEPIEEALEEDLAALREKLEGDPAVNDLLHKYQDRIDEDGRVYFDTEEDEYSDDETDGIDDLAEDFPAEVIDDEPEPTVPSFTMVRDPHGPYVISIDDFMEEEGEDSPFSKLEMTYFEGDATLVDSRNQIIPNIEETIGMKNLDKFGIGTTADDQVYIRNERMEFDAEVTKDDRTYSQVILGIPTDEDVQRSMLKPLKMRDGDGD